MRVIISGGAAIDPAILQFFNDIGIIAVQGYGLTECSPMAALNPDVPKDMRNASVGHLLPGMEVKVVDKDENGIGEICFKGGNVMMGYYKNPEATAEVLKDGWFYTGDLGYVDNEDFIYITGRKKNVIITKNGKMYSRKNWNIFSAKSHTLQRAWYGERMAKTALTIRPSSQQ